MGKWISFATLMVALVVTGSACSRPAPILRIGTNVWPGYEPLYLARNLGYFGDEPIRLVEFSSATQVIHALHHRTIEMATLTLDELLLARAEGVTSRVVLVTDISNGADVILARPPIATISDLKGKRVGLEDTALGAYMLTRALELGGLKPEDITTFSVQVDGHEAAFREQHVDAIVTFEPFATRLRAAGAVSIFDSSLIPNEIMDVLVASDNLPPESQRTINTVLRAWFRAVQDLHSRPEFAARQMSSRMQLEPEQVLHAYTLIQLPSPQQNLDLLAASPPAIEPIAQRLGEQMIQHRLVKRLETSTPLVDAEPLRAVGIAP